jgi:steroid delta-isomerase-like uncharacterized protein
MDLAWAKQWFSAFSGNVDKLMEFYADDVQFEDVIFAHTETSKAGLKTFFSSLGGPDAGEHVFAVDAYAGDGNGGAVEWSWQAKHASNFLGVPAKGKETDVKGVSILTFKNGKIASQHDYWNANAALRQLGAVK